MSHKGCMNIIIILTNWFIGDKLMVRFIEYKPNDKEVDNMHEMRLGVIETRFAELIWDNEPLTSGQLVKLCQENLTWKKPTTYTVLRKLCERGIFQNQDGTVTALISREDFYARQTREYVQETFEGSLPAFLAAFTARTKLTDQEIDQLQQLIDSQRGENHD